MLRDLEYYVCVTVMCCYSTVGYRVTVMCVCYCNVLLQYSWVQCYCYVCDCQVLLQYSWVQGYCYVCVCYCNVLLQYSWLQGYYYVCETVMCCYSTL